jgi:Zn-dependent oligopeptidase
MTTRACAAAAWTLSAVIAAAVTATSADFYPSPQLRFDRTPAELTAHCATARARAMERLEAVAKAAPAPTFATTVVALDDAVAGFVDDTASDRFMKDVAPAADVREAALGCSTSLQQLVLEVYARPDLYQAVRAFADTKPALSGEDQRLLERELRDFKRNGLLLPPAERESLLALRKHVVELEQKFQRNVAEVRDGAWMSRDDLAGVPDDFVARLKQEDGKYWVGLDYPDYGPFMANASHADARKRLEHVFNDRAAKDNLSILKDVLALRQDAAHRLGYRTYADFKLENNMAHDSRTVRAFFDRLVPRLRVLGRRELAELQALKRKDVGPKGDAHIYAWDFRYYDNQLRKQRYAVDMDKVKEYFPLETVRRGMFEVYEKLLGVRFQPVAGAAVWAPGVELFEIRDAAGETAIAYFYMDLFPREGKFKHVAEFALVHGRMVDGHYQVPSAAVVANFNPPANGRPSLLTHGEAGEVEAVPRVRPRDAPDAHTGEVRPLLRSQRRRRLRGGAFSDARELGVGSHDHRQDVGTLGRSRADATCGSAQASHRRQESGFGAAQSPAAYLRDRRHGLPHGRRGRHDESVGAGREGHRADSAFRGDAPRGEFRPYPGRL